jgi:hypothetical protein
LRDRAGDQTQCKGRDCRGLDHHGTVTFHIKSSTSSA